MEKLDLAVIALANMSEPDLASAIQSARSGYLRNLEESAAFCASKSRESGGSVELDRMVAKLEKFKREAQILSGPARSVVEVGSIRHKQVQTPIEISEDGDKSIFQFMDMGALVVCAKDLELRFFAPGVTGFSSYHDDGFGGIRTDVPLEAPEWFMTTTPVEFHFAIRSGEFSVVKTLREMSFARLSVGEASKIFLVVDVEDPALEAVLKHGDVIVITKKWLESLG